MHKQASKQTFLAISWFGYRKVMCTQNSLYYFYSLARLLHADDGKRTCFKI